MGLFKRAHVRGMVHELTRQGIVAWPTKEAEEEAADAIADSIPEEEIPEVTEEEGLTEEEAEEVLNKIVEVAEAIEAKTGGARDYGVNKMAAEMSYEVAASQAAISVMQKAAEETGAETGPMVPGTGDPTVDNSATAEGKIDEINVPSADLVVPQGTSAVDTSAGAVGAEQEQNQPGAQASTPTGEVAKLSSILKALNKYAADANGASLSGGPVIGPSPNPRQDVDDNLKIQGVVAPGQGKTTQTIPQGANVGQILRHPGGTPGPTDQIKNDVAADPIKKAAAMLRSTQGGRNILHKLAEEARIAEQETLRQQEEAAAHALMSLARTLS